MTELPLRIGDFTIVGADQRMISLHEAADLLRLPHNAFQSMVAAGDGPRRITSPDGTVRFRFADVRTWEPYLPT